MFAIAVEFAQGVGLAALIALLYAETRRHLTRNRHVRQVIGGAAFALAAVLAMATPVAVADGVFIDSRNVIVVLAAPALGILGGVVTALLAALFRVWTGGVGEFAGVAGIAIAAVVGILMRVRLRREQRRLELRDLLVLANAVCLALFATLLLPEAARTPVLNNLPLYAFANMLGVLAFGLMLIREADRIDAEQQLRRLAMSDALTGLANRRRFEAALAAAWRETSASGEALAVMVLDLDGFKQINDRLGHDAGDRALKELARAIAAAAGPGGCAARLGGDEFAVLLRGAEATGTDALRRRIEAALAEAAPRIGATVTTSIGAALRDRETLDAAGLVKLADQNLYARKHERATRRTQPLRSIAAA